MTNAEAVRKEFWKTFDKMLIEEGLSVKLTHEMAGKPTHWANVNKYHAFNNNAVDISLVQRQNVIRIGFYIDDRNSRIGRLILANKQKIDEKISFPLHWESGTRNPNTLRVVTYVPFDFLRNSYREVVQECLPKLYEFIILAYEYGKKEFFDF